MAILMHLTVRESCYVDYENSLHNICSSLTSSIPLYAWFNSPCYHPPPPGYIPGDLSFFLTYSPWFRLTTKLASWEN